MNPDHRWAQLLSRAWPFMHGGGRIVDRLFAGLAFEVRPQIVNTRDGFLMTVDPNDLIGRHLYLRGEFDYSNVELLCRLARPGDTLLDIGANIGYVSACFLARVPQSKVVTVEPQPAIIRLLTENLSKFGEERFTVLPFALSNENGEVTFKLNAENSGAGRIQANDQGGASSKSIIVQRRAADAVYQAGSFGRCNLVKIDVEGHEEEVFHSCRTAFHDLAPRAILFEQEGHKAAPNGPIGKLLSELGYDVFGLKKSLNSLDLVRISDASDCRFNDYVGILRKS